MLRSALGLLSMLQIGGRVRQSLDRLLRQALITAVAIVFLIAAAAFGLLASYRELLDNLSAAGGRASNGPRTPATRPIGAWGLAAHCPESRTTLSPAVRNPIDATVSQIGPFPLVLIAFAGGVLAGRR